jgi:2-keto-4-pentenoate hydratase/2-oxohepta-3-ene-1,7-dioic acid hydratase in catechol pathway
MRFLRFQNNGREGLAIEDGREAHGLYADDARYPGSLAAIIGAGANALTRAADLLRKGAPIDLDAIDFLPPLGQTGKIICLGGNYPAHVKEVGLKIPPHPTIFARFPSSLVGHRANLIRPRVSTQFDYEGELVAVIGKHGRHIPEGKALEHVVGYSIFNDASVRDYQIETPQWTVGKNFDGTGALGPYLVTADEVPPGGSGLRLETRLNGQVVQGGLTTEMIYSVATTISFLSQAMTIDPGDLLIMGTPPGVGMARKPPLYMKAGDRCEVAVEGLGILSNAVVDEA